MAHKGIKIADQDGGESVACRDAVNPDDEANGRVVQLVDQASQPAGFLAADTPIRNSVVSDARDLAPLPAGVGDTASSRLDVSDAGGFIFFARVGSPTSGVTDSTVVVTPVAITDDATPSFACAYPPVTLVPVSPTKVGQVGDMLEIAPRVYTSQTVYLPNLGANQVAFHLTFGGDALVSFELFAYKVSGNGRLVDIDTDVNEGVWGGVVFPV